MTALPHALKCRALVARTSAMMRRAHAAASLSSSSSSSSVSLTRTRPFALGQSRPFSTSSSAAPTFDFKTPVYKQLPKDGKTAAKKPFERILVANRGEIACRVIKTCRALGIETVAIYSDADKSAVHVQMADFKAKIEPSVAGSNAAQDTYLNMNEIVRICKATGAQAVHPGYGFLSENAAFQELLESQGITFIGPSAYSIQACGDKLNSKHLAKSIGVPMIPGYLGEVRDQQQLLEVCKQIGYPVMVKAAGGGGGKGMRVARNDEEAIAGFELSRGESIASFKNDRMLVEKFIESPRHVEVQMLVDQFGNGVYLFDRECTVQRRNQKVIEEAPAPCLSPETRKAMGECAIKLAKAVGYHNAGTCEFLVPGKRNPNDPEFYFLEVNTRLQVEHPITEQVCNIDLVEQQIRVAAGLPLDFEQKDVKIHGHSFEARLYAEDPAKGFLPSIGTLSVYREPKTNIRQGDREAQLEEVEFVSREVAQCPSPSSYLNQPENAALFNSMFAAPLLRIDSGITEGSEISIFYDPMISKLISHGRDRDEALLLLVQALDRYRLEGVRHNTDFLRSLATHPRFQAGDFSTAFIPEEYGPKSIQKKKYLGNLAQKVAAPADKDAVIFSPAFSLGEIDHLLAASTIVRLTEQQTSYRSLAQASAPASSPSSVSYGSAGSFSNLSDAKSALLSRARQAVVALPFANRQLYVRDSSSEKHFVPTNTISSANNQLLFQVDLLGWRQAGTIPLDLLSGGAGEKLSLRNNQSASDFGFDFALPSTSSSSAFNSYSGSALAVQSVPVVEYQVSIETIGSSPSESKIFSAQFPKRRTLQIRAAYLPGQPYFLVEDSDASSSQSTPSLVQVLPTGSGFSASNLSVSLALQGCRFDAVVAPPSTFRMLGHMPQQESQDLSKLVTSPMPGSIFALKVTEGQVISAGQELLVVEAMKMQNSIRAKSDGVVKKILVKQGQTVQADQKLIEFE